MICYLDSKSDTMLKVCSAEKFAELTEDQRTSVLIEAYRSGQNPGAKQMLPAFVFQGYDPKMLESGTGSRKKSALKPTGLVMHDFDHISLTPDPSPARTCSLSQSEATERKGEGSKMTPQMVYDRFLAAMPKLGLTLEDDLALAHITPSGDGLRLVLRSRKNRDVAEDQKWIADALGVECDVHVKDLSRLSFVPKREDILYYNAPLLFAEIITPNTTAKNAIPKENPVRDALSVAQGFNPGIANGIGKSSPSGEASVIKETSPKGEGATADEIPGDESLRYKEEKPTASIFPETYNGIPYKRIVEELITVHGGTPQIGNRENTIFRLASDLAKITDRSAPWLESLIPTFGLPESEWRTTIAQVCKKPLETSMSRKLQEAIKRCEAVKNVESAVESEENGENMPPALPEKLPRLIELLTSKVMPFQKPAVATMVFPALATYVNDAQFYMHDDDVTELSMMAVLTGKQSIGKSCINKPIKHILARIAAQDDINRQRIKAWAEKKKNKKQSERGESMPSCPVRLLSSDTSSAAFLLRLEAAEKGDELRKNLCTYTHVDEIEELYKFCTTGGKTGIRQQIKKAWDRAETGSERATENAVNVKTVLRWNWTASTTIEMCRQFFDKCLVGGETSRVDFCTMIAPMVKMRFKYGRYDQEFLERLKPYIDNLENYKCERDEYGSIIPARYERIDELIGQVLDYMEKTADAEVDETYADYGKRAVIMTFKKLLILYIANGCVWEDEFEPFIWWSFKYSMWCKMNLFYEKASQKFIEEQIVPSGKRSPLKYMSRRFTMAEFTEQCRKMGLNTPPFRIISRYKGRGVVAQVEDGIVVSDEFCQKFGIK